MCLVSMTMPRKDNEVEGPSTFLKLGNAQGFTALDYGVEICLAFIGVRGPQ